MRTWYSERSRLADLLKHLASDKQLGPGPPLLRACHHGVERTTGMRCHKLFGTRENLVSDFDERPVRAVDRDVLKYRRKPWRID